MWGMHLLPVTAVCSENNGSREATLDFETMPVDPPSTTISQQNCTASMISFRMNILLVVVEYR
jgi:hypothetical protein